MVTPITRRDQGTKKISNTSKSAGRTAAKAKKERHGGRKEDDGKDAKSTAKKNTATADKTAAKTAKKTPQGAESARQKKQHAGSASPEILAKINAITELNTELRNEIKTISKTFAGNQKRMSSISGMSESLAAVLLQIQKQSRQISNLKKETQGLFSGLEEIGGQAGTIKKLDRRLREFQAQAKDAAAAAADAEEQKSSDAKAITKKINDGVKTIKESTEAIANLSQAVDAARTEIKIVAARSASAARTGAEIDTLRSEIEKMTDVTQSDSTINILRNDIEKIAGRVAKSSADTKSLKAEIVKMAQSVSSVKDLRDEIQSATDEAAKSSRTDSQNVKRVIDDIAGMISRIDNMSQDIDLFRGQINEIISKAKTAEDIAAAASKTTTGKLERASSEIESLVKRLNANAFVGEGLKAVQKDLSALKSDTADSIQKLVQKLAHTSDALQRQEDGATEVYKKVSEIYSQIQDAKDTAKKVERDSAIETTRLLKLAEYQSSIRMNAESKYGDLATIKEMARQTAEIAALFDRDVIIIGSESNANHDDAIADGANGLPQEVKRWAIGKILDSADRWEIRFADAYTAMKESIGIKMLREELRIQQVRDIYGIRAVKEIRDEIGSLQ